MRVSEPLEWSRQPLSRASRDPRRGGTGSAPGAGTSRARLLLPTGTCWAAVGRGGPGAPTLSLVMVLCPFAYGLPFFS